MPLVIRTTGLEQYAPGGEARVKVLLIGGAGSGKTRWSSYFPKPIYADCEGGLASVADRRVPYVTVNTSTDMADLLNHVKMDGRLPKDKRTIETVVIDTLDAYQRKLKNEWMEANKKESFSGWEAWGFLDQKMQLLLTKLLNLDVNVVVAAHYKDKVSRDDDKETHELMLQLSGDIKDTAFNDFDLVGWMGTYWEAVAGERVEKRGVTFRRTPDKPFLKDRLHVTPPWLEVTFADSDYQNLFSRIVAKIDGLAPSETIGQIDTAPIEVPGTVATPEKVASGPLPTQAPVELPLTQLDKPALLKKARDLGITTLKDGSPIKGNTLKSELIAAIESHQAKPSVAPEPASAGNGQNTATKDVKVPVQSPAPGIESVAEGVVDTTTGELIDDEVESDGPPAVLETQPVKTESAPTEETAVQTVREKLGGEVIGVEETQTASAAPTAPARPTQSTSAAPTSTAGGNRYAGQKCADCGKDLGDEDENYVKLAQIKYRTLLGQDCYQARKRP